jgi:hypothetical protein
MTDVRARTEHAGVRFARVGFAFASFMCNFFGLCLDRLSASSRSLM